MENLDCLLATPALIVSHDAENHWLYIQWCGPHDAESVRRCAESVFACLAMHPCPRVLSDHTQLQGDWQAAISSVVRQNFERLAAHGVEYVAWVHSYDYGDCMAMERVVRHTDRPIVGLCDDVALACDWLRHCPPLHPAPGSTPRQFWAL